MPNLERSFAVALKDGREATIREARATDYFDYVAGIREVVDERPRTLLVQPGEFWDETEFASRLVPWSPSGARLFAYLEDRFVGSISIHGRHMAANKHVAEFGIFLVKDARGLGLGGHLLSLADKWAADHGVTRLEMAVFAHNERAQRLYRACGYEVEGYEKRAVRFPDGYVDEIRMAKLL